MNKCAVCNNETNNCPPSPFFPYSGWRCESCVKQKLIPLKDLLILLESKTAKNLHEKLKEFDNWWNGNKNEGIKYALKYWMPTTFYFKMTLEEAWQKANK